ncbi:phosphatidylinositol-specific phospholipase C1-like protein [bacterium]|nr:phosphatidylinositol-specific phospholipase C1-like protein [bacterium]
MIRLCYSELFLFLFFSLNLGSEEALEPNGKDKNNEPISGVFRKNGTQLSFEIISSQLPVDELWMHRVASISPRLAVRVSDNGNRLLLNPGANLPVVVNVKVRSYIVKKSDLNLSMNQIQTIGTHNSYHIAPHPSVMKLIKSIMPGQADSISYTHRPLSEQLDLLGMRKFELDLFHDTKGGSYSSPAGAVMTNGSNWKIKHPEFDEEAMSKTGMKIIHFPNFDFRSNTPTIKAALKEINRWSRRNACHIPIMILIETKKVKRSVKSAERNTFQVPDFLALEKEILSILDIRQIITPDNVKGNFDSLNKAVTIKGWPSLYQARGRFIFALDNQGEERINYLTLHPELKGALIFVSSPPGNPESAFLKINDPVVNYLAIKNRVKEGYLVRTRADSDLAEAKNNDYSKMRKAFSSGAQFISTDFPESVKGVSSYRVSLPGNVRTGRLNPLFYSTEELNSLEGMSGTVLIRNFLLKIPKTESKGKIND